MLRLIVGAMFLICFTLKAQYTAFPQLEQLYIKGNYQKCIDEANEELTKQKNNAELMPLVWQLKSYLAIDNLTSHSLKKNALDKAFKIALKLKKKDKEEKLKENIADDIQIVISKQLDAAKILCENNVTKANEIYTKLLQLSALNSIKFKQYKCLKYNNSIGVESMLKNLVVSNYQQYKSKDPLFETLDYAFAELILVYLQIDKNNLAKDVYTKAKEIYPLSNECKQSFFNYTDELTQSLKYNNNDDEIYKAIKQIQLIDSIIPSPIFQNQAHYFYGKLLKKEIEAINNSMPKTLQISNQYFNGNKTDTLAKIILEALSENSLKEDIFNDWINIHQDLKKQLKPIAAIKDINQYLINQKLFDLDFEFIQYCKLKYPNYKTEIALMSTTLNTLISKQINDAKNTNIETIDKYAQLIKSKEVKDKQYQLYFNELNKLLAEKNYSGFSVTCAKALNIFANDAKILALKKQYIIEDYKANILSINQYDGYNSFFEKTENISKCDAGIVNTIGQKIVLQTINYVRRLAGVPDSCSLEPILNQKCQKAALMMTANSDLNHSPPKTWKCYTTEGSDAAGSSNLSLGHAFHDAILGQIEDNGANNFACGHRRWILNPFCVTFGHGSTNSATSLWVFGSGYNKRKINYNKDKPIMWPSADYFPLALIPSRWSFSLASGDFEDAKITVLENGKPIKINIEKLYQGYGLNTVVWYLDKEIIENAIYIVEISNIKRYEGYDYKNNKSINSIHNFKYKVIPIKIE